MKERTSPHMEVRLSLVRQLSIANTQNKVEDAFNLDIEKVEK